MFNKFQQLFLKLMSENTAGPGGVFGSGDAWSPENQSSIDTRATMSIVNWKNKKKKNRLTKRKLDRSL
jgi:hypothetical protein